VFGERPAQCGRMRRFLIALAGLGLLGASVLPNSAGATLHTSVDDFVANPTATPTPTPELPLVFPQQRAGTPTPQVKIKP